MHLNLSDLANTFKSHTIISSAITLLERSIIKRNYAFGILLPIPPAVWNGAIDAMIATLKAGNTLQKAIAAGAREILSRNGTQAQAAEFSRINNEKYGARFEKINRPAEELPVIDPAINVPEAIRAGVEYILNNGGSKAVADEFSNRFSAKLKKYNLPTEDAPLESTETPNEELPVIDPVNSIEMEMKHCKGEKTPISGSPIQSLNKFLRMKYTWIGIIVVLILTNPSRSAFTSYLHQSGSAGIGRKYNFFVCSIYSDNNNSGYRGGSFHPKTDLYIGFLGNFIQLY